MSADDTRLLAEARQQRHEAAVLARDALRRQRNARATLGVAIAVFLATLVLIAVQELAS